MTRGDSFENLNKCQVEALLECFDFLRNGYRPLIDFFGKNLWVIKLRHCRNYKTIIIHIYHSCYYITTGKNRVKYAAFKSSPERYRVIVNSDMSIGVMKMTPSGDSEFIPGSLSTNKNA